MDPLVVGANDLLRFPAPAVVGGIEILVGARCQRIQHEKLFRAERAAKRGPDGSGFGVN